MTLIFNVEFAFAEGIPKLDGPVTRTGYDLSVVGGETDRKNVRSVAYKATGGRSGVKVPEAKRMVPGRRKSELTVRGDHDVGNKVIMSSKHPLGISEAVLANIPGELPDNNSFVPRRRKDHVLVLCGRRDGRHHSLVPMQRAKVAQMFRHFDG